MRVDDASTRNALLSHLQDSGARLFKLQQQAASGNKYQRPSDDVPGYEQMLNRSADMSRMEALKSRLAEDNSRIDQYDSLLGEFTQTVRNVRTLVQRASNAATDPTAMSDLANEVDLLIKTTLSQANTDQHGRYMFGGTKTSSPPFVATPPDGKIQSVSYQGDHAFPAPQLPGGLQLDMKLNGEAVMAGGGQDMFATLIDLRNQLEQGTVDAATVMPKLAALEQNFLERRVETGAASKYLGELRQATEDRRLAVETQQSNEAGADPAETITRLLQAENTHQMNLQVAARVGRLSLVDYLR